MSWSPLASIHAFLVTLPRSTLPSSYTKQHKSFQNTAVSRTLNTCLDVYSSLSRIPCSCNLLFPLAILSKPLKLRSNINIDWEFLLTSLNLSSGALPPLWSCNTQLISVLGFITYYDNNLFTCLSPPLYLKSLQTQSYVCIPSISAQCLQKWHALNKCPWTKESRQHN